MPCRESKKDEIHGRWVLLSLDPNGGIFWGLFGKRSARPFRISSRDDTKLLSFEMSSVSTFRFWLPRGASYYTRMQYLLLS